MKLLKANPDFRHLWYGQVVSELGDWLNSMAIYALILSISGSGMAMAAVRTGKARSSKIATINNDQMTSGRRMNVIPGARMFIMVVM